MRLMYSVTILAFCSRLKAEVLQNHPGPLPYVHIVLDDRASRPDEGFRHCGDAGRDKLLSEPIVVIVGGSQPLAVADYWLGRPTSLAYWSIVAITIALLIAKRDIVRVDEVGMEPVFSPQYAGRRGKGSSKDGD